jgi:hypothetical protein
MPHKEHKGHLMLCVSLLSASRSRHALMLIGRVDNTNLQTFRTIADISNIKIVFDRIKHNILFYSNKNTEQKDNAMTDENKTFCWSIF